jgi:hypothetical protein
MKTTKTIDFNRDTSGDRKGLRRMFAALAALLVLFAVVFALLLAKNGFSLNRLLGAETSLPEPSETENGAAGEPAAAPEAGAVNVLFLCSSEKEVVFCSVFSFLPAANAVRVKPVSPELSLPRGDGAARISEIFYNFGAAEVAEALSAKNVTVHRWVSVNEAKFRLLLQKFGDTPVTLPNPVDFTVDAIRYQFGKGAHTLTADALVSVMKYGYAGDDALRFQAQAMADVLKNDLTAENVLRGEAFFAELVNMVDCNISAFDYAAYKQRLADFLSNSPEISAIS